MLKCTKFDFTVLLQAPSWIQGVLLIREKGRERKKGTGKKGERKGGNERIGGVRGISRTLAEA